MDEDQPLADSNEVPSVRPRRWQRIRLAILLCVLVAMCAVLGGWQLYARYLGPYVEAAGPAVAGEPLMLRGRFIDLLGFDTERFVVLVCKLNPDGGRVVFQSARGHAARNGLCNYDFEIKLKQIPNDGNYDIEVQPLTRAVHTRRESSEADSVWGKIVVSPKQQKKE